MNPFHQSERPVVFFCLLATISSIVSGSAEPALTIYNQNFAVVRDAVPLNLKAGVNSVQFKETTVHLEPDSVILRDPSKGTSLQILEQGFRADPISQDLLLNIFEGKTIDFLVQKGDHTETVVGKIIRSGYVPHQAAYRRYGSEYTMAQQGYSGYSDTGQPIIEVDGKLRFSLPGQPIFPSLTDDTILKPTLSWVIQSDKPAMLNAELSYVTGGMSWDADYNIVGSDQAATLDLLGWVTMDNQSGKTFENARIKLMAGDVSKMAQDDPYKAKRYGLIVDSIGPQGGTAPVSERAFEDYHLYTLERATTLRDRETKQVEFVRASGIQAQKIYVYDGARIPFNRYNSYSPEGIRQDPNYGVESNPKIWIMTEFSNSKENHLGIPLPKGRVRFYHGDSDGALEFTGENIIDHTAANEKIRVNTGNAFDLAGERRRTEFRVDHARSWATESFEITLRNHKKEAVEIRVVEHLYRWNTWEVVKKSDSFLQKDSQTIEFRVPVKPEEETKISYTVEYKW